MGTWIDSEAFGWGIVRLATYVANSSTQPRLLFGSVSLLTKDRPQPRGTLGVADIKIAKGKGGIVFFRRTVLSAPNAIDWYRAASFDSIRTPIPFKDPDSRYDGLQLTGTDFIDDPIWPSLGIPTGPDLLSGVGSAGDPAPFIGAGSLPARIHRRFGDNRNFEAVIEDIDAVRFLKRRIHFDLADYREYLGSLALVVPNPIVRNVAHYLAPVGDRGEENLVFHVMPRTGATLAGVTLTIFERRANLLSRYETVTVPGDGLVIINEPVPIQESGYALSQPDHGVLVYQPPLSFLRSVHVSIGMMGRRVRVEAPKTDSPRAPSAAYTVHELSAETPIRVGDETDRPDLSRIYQGAARRERRAMAKRYDQTWFGDGERDAAISFLRSRIALAREQVLVADPYFGGLDQMRFLHAVHRKDILMTILTSRLAFEAPLPEDTRASTPQDSSSNTPATAAGAEKQSAESLRLDTFARALASLGQRGIKNVSAFVLLGTIPPLHDRFLVVDGKVWFLGNSLNALGSRASMILQVPDAEPVLNHLGDMQRQAISFEQYVDQRSKAKTRRRRKDG